MSCNNTVNKDEIEHFGKVIWWNENPELKILKAMNSVRVPFVKESLINNNVIQENQIDSPTPLLGLKIADIGCGGGYLSEPLARLGAQVTGIDACGSAIEQAIQHAALDPSLESHLTYLETTFEGFAETHKEFFDVIVASEVIEHVENKESFLKLCHAILKPGCSLILTTISKTFALWLIVVHLSEYLRVIPRGTHQYSKLITPEKLTTHLKQNNFRTLDTRKMFYYPYLGWVWSSLNTYYALHARKDE